MGSSSSGLRGRNGAYAAPEEVDPATEKENDAILAALLTNVRTVNRSLKEVNKEVNTHITLLDQLLNRTRTANNKVHGTVKKLQEATGLSSVYHVWFLILVAFIVFCYIVLLLKHRR